MSVSLQSHEHNTGFSSLTIPYRTVLFYVDIDECSEGLDSCQRDNHFCLNTEGNYTCQPRHDTKCPAGYKYNRAAATCEGNVTVP